MAGGSEEVVQRRPEMRAAEAAAAGEAARVRAQGSCSLGEVGARVGRHL
jgi:hypothetical protein